MTDGTHDPLCIEGEACLCRRLQAAKADERRRILDAVNAVPDEPDTAVWYERFRDDPDDIDKVTIMVQLDRVIAAIEAS